MASTLLGVGSPLLDVLAQVSDDFLERHVSGAKGGMEMISPADRSELMRRLGDDVTWAPGGSAGNTVFALAKLGVPVAMLGKTGKDKEGAFYREKLRVLGGSDREFSETSDAPTGVCVSLITPDAERTMRSDLAAAMLLDENDVKKVDFSRYDVVLIEGYMLFSPTFDTVFGMAKKAGCAIAFDLASFEVVRLFRDRVKKLLEDVDILFANADEARELAGDLPPEKQLAALSADRAVTALKLGREGALVKGGGETLCVPARLVENPVDTTAAGDLWAAGFLYGFLNARPLEKCARCGALLAGEVVKVIGSQLPEEVWKKIAKELD
ncbi:MAG: adenosine kinase [Lentisphaeria bacterium]|nr:adenosine kinase [Lentisphaeria bacterium]